MFTKKLKIILQSKILYLLITVFIIFYIIFFTKVIKYQSNYLDGHYQIIGEVIKYSLTDTKISLVIKTSEKINVTYYYDDLKELKDLKIGSKIRVEGEMITPSNNTIPNTFNYHKYLYSNRIYITMHAKSLEIIENKTTPLEWIKNYINKQVERNEYLKLFIVGDKSSLDSKVYENFKDVGVAHLLAVSGMHVSIFVSILKSVLKRIKDSCRTFIIIVFLLFYAYIVNYSASILRVVIFFILNSINKALKLNLSNKQILFFSAVIMLLINPFFIYQVGFLYSFVTVYSILLTQKYLKGNYILDLLIISFWALLFTLPITVSLNYEINLITFISNLILVPFVTFILYPFSLLCFIFSFLIPIFTFLTNIMEMFINYIGEINFFMINIPKLNMLVIIFYYVLLLLLVHYNLKRYFILLVFIMFFVKAEGYFESSFQLHFLDVGQGDLSIIIFPRCQKVIMIDTGGIISFGKDSNYSISNNIILFLKSLGITNLDYLIITHGDYDHMGEAINLVENFKVEKVIFNCGEFNELEKDLIKVLDKKKILYYSCVKELNMNDDKLYFLNSGDYGNENDNSSVIYTELNNYKFLFMGDAGVEVEEDLINKYNLQDIDVLKVGHHGSKTSSSKEFINNINPKYSIISVGKNNRYGHPNGSVLENLNNSKIYKTDQDGSIMFKIKNNKLKIETCTP